MSYPVSFCGKNQKDSLHSLLYEKPFYKEKNCFNETMKSFAEEGLLSVSYKSTSSNAIAKKIFSILIFPIGLYKSLHKLLGKILVPASFTYSKECLANYRTSFLRKSIFNEWKYRRFTVEVNGHKIDAVIMGKEETLQNKRWTLKSIGNGFCYENFLDGKAMEFGSILKKTKSNALLFNYSGVGPSSSWPDKKIIIKTYQTMLSILEDKKNGIGATEIIGDGHSLGGGVQGEALKNFTPKEGISYVFVKNKTFSNLSDVASKMVHRVAGLAVKWLGWEMNSTESSKRLEKLRIPQIVIQTMKSEENRKEKGKFFPDDIVDDNSKHSHFMKKQVVIHKDASLAQHLLKNNPDLKYTKFISAKDEDHSHLTVGKEEGEKIASEINKALESACSTQKKN